MPSASQYFRLRTIRTLLAFVVMIVVISCAGALATGVGSKAPANIVIVEGAAQIGQAGKDLPTPVVLRVVDSSGGGVPGVTVTLSVSLGGGTVTPASDTTDVHGEFKSKWTLGPGIVAQELLAAARGLPPVSIGATGLLPSQIVLVQGNNQSAKAGSALTNAVVVRVVGANNVPMQGVTVGFQVLTGGGGMTPATVVTNALGEASTKWTLGAAGSNTAFVASGSLPSIPVTATATP